MSGTIITKNRSDYLKMWSYSISLLVILNLCSSYNGFYHNIKASIPSKGYNGEPLFLTPLIKEGKIEEARSLSKVAAFVGSVESYAGFFTVNETYQSNIFFWYFPAEENPEEAPVAVWLQGGPGASSLYGLFAEHGPYQIKNESSLALRKYSWTKSISLIYIDNPVGTGYSFTKDSRGYAKNEQDVSENLYKTITQFFQLFPELSKNKFYVLGESYGGKYAPIMAYKIHEKNKVTKNQINLEGVAIGNGFSDPVNMLNYGEYLYEHGLIDSNTKTLFDKARDQARDFIHSNKYSDAFKVFDKLLNSDIGHYPSLFTNVTGFTTYFNYLYDRDVSLDTVSILVQQDFVRQKIHVGNLTFNVDKTVEINLADDMMKSVAPEIEILLNAGYKFMTYNGQLDIIVAYPLTLEFLKNLNWNGSEDYKIAQRHIWKVGNDIGGYVKITKNLVEVLVRDAGHMVPSDQPIFAYDLITRFIFEKSFY